MESHKFIKSKIFWSKVLFLLLDSSWRSIFISWNIFVFLINFIQVIPHDIHKISVIYKALHYEEMFVFGCNYRSQINYNSNRFCNWNCYTQKIKQFDSRQRIFFNVATRTGRICLLEHVQKPFCCKNSSDNNFPSRKKEIEVKKKKDNLPCILKNNSRHYLYI